MGHSASTIKEDPLLSCKSILMLAHKVQGNAKAPMNDELIDLMSQDFRAKLPPNCDPQVIDEALKLFGKDLRLEPLTQERNRSFTNSEADLLGDLHVLIVVDMAVTLQNIREIAHAAGFAIEIDSAVSDVILPTNIQCLLSDSSIRGGIVSAHSLMSMLDSAGVEKFQHTYQNFVMFVITSSSSFETSNPAHKDQIVVSSRTFCSRTFKNSLGDALSIEFNKRPVRWLEQQLREFVSRRIEIGDQIASEMKRARTLKDYVCGDSPQIEFDQLSYLDSTVANISSSRPEEVKPLCRLEIETTSGLTALLERARFPWAILCGVSAALPGTPVDNFAEFKSTILAVRACRLFIERTYTPVYRGLKELKL